MPCLTCIPFPAIPPFRRGKSESSASWAGAKAGPFLFGQRFARRMARAIVGERVKAPITRTVHLAKIIAEANPSWEKGKHPATRAFQGIRIYINRELDDLQLFLDGVLDVLAVGGRLVVISFHSLEDRMVKRFIRDQVRGKPLPRGLPVMEKDLQRRMKLVGKPQKATQAEVAGNIRSRSAIMRVAEKVA